MHRGFQAAGHKGALKEWVREMELARSRGENVPSFVLAFVYVFLGEKDHAFAWLEKAYQERDPALQGLKVDPTWDAIRSDPRFKAIAQKVGLAP